MQFAQESDRYDYIAANLEGIGTVVWGYWHRTGRFSSSDIEENTQAFVLHLMVTPKVLDRYDSSYSLRAYLGTVFKFWYADLVKSDPYRHRRSKADLDVLTDVIADEKDKTSFVDRIAQEEGESDEYIYSLVREVENTILDLVMEAIEADLSEHYACLFGLVRFDRSNLSLAQKLGLPVSEVRTQRTRLERYIRRLRINGVKLGEYFWEAVATIRLGGEPEPIEMSVNGITSTDETERREWIWDKVTQQRKTSGNHNYGPLKDNECTSADIRKILFSYLSGRQNPWHRITEWVKQGRLLKARSNGNTNSYRRVIYNLRSVYDLKTELDAEAQCVRDKVEAGKQQPADVYTKARLEAGAGPLVNVFPVAADPRPVGPPLLEE